MDMEPVLGWLRHADRSDPESYAFYLQEGIDRRRTKPKKSKDPIGNFYTEWIRHLEEKSIERLVGREYTLGRVSLETLVIWLAHQVYEIPAKNVAEYYGFGSPATVRMTCSRMQERIETDSALREALESDTILTTLKPKLRPSG
jgi:hypothetical protein